MKVPGGLTNKMAGLYEALQREVGSFVLVVTSSTSGSGRMSRSRREGR